MKRERGIRCWKWLATLAALIAIVGLLAGPAAAAIGPQATLSSSSLDFGTVALGTQSPVQTIVVTNNGDADLHVSGVATFVPLDAFTTRDTCLGVAVAPGGKCAFDVYARPVSGASQQTGLMQLSSDSSSVPSLNVTFKVVDSGPIGGWYPLLTNGVSYNGISCPSRTVCMAAGGISQNFNITRTTDGGINWVTKRNDSGGNGFFGVSCPTELVCWVTTADSSILKTTDGGDTWTNQTTTIPFTEGIQCPTVLVCYVVGQDANTGSIITLTTDGGTNWSTPAVTDGTAAFSVSCSDTTHCIVVAGRDVFTTSDGNTWLKHPQGPFLSSLSVACADALTCLNTDNFGTVYRTTDGGDTWSLSYDANTYTNGYVGCKHDYCTLAIQGGLLVTVTTGATWETEVPAQTPLVQTTAISCPGAGRCFVAGSNGVVLRRGKPQGTLAIKSSGVAGVQEGTAFTGVLATGSGGVQPLTAQVVWGDGTTSAGTVTVNTDGTYSVGGGHTYPEGGALMRTVTVTDASGMSLPSTTKQSVKDYGLSQKAPKTIAVGVGVQFNGQLTIVKDTDPGTPPKTEYTASIEWGDATGTTPGTVSGSIPYGVFGTHTYTHAGSFTVTVTLADVGGANSTKTLTLQAS